MVPAFVALQLVLLAALTMGWREAAVAPPAVATPAVAPPIAPTPEVDFRWSLAGEGWPPPFVAACDGATPIACGEVVTGTTWDEPRAIGASFYRDAACQGAGEDHAGPERVFGLQVVTEGTYTVHATVGWPATALQVVILDASGACPGDEPAPDRCVAAGPDADAMVTAHGVSQWWLVVDGPYSDAFTLQVTCSAS